jgi:hypothetical protein
MATAGIKPTARDRKEALLMGSEKIVAIYQFWRASAGLMPVHAKAVANARRLWHTTTPTLDRALNRTRGKGRAG